MKDVALRRLLVLRRQVAVAPEQAPEPLPRVASAERRLALLLVDVVQPRLPVVAAAVAVEP